MQSDNYGRKTLVVPLLIIMSGLGLASANMPTFVSFVVVRSLCAMTFIGEEITLFKVDIEICSCCKNATFKTKISSHFQHYTFWKINEISYMTSGSEEGLMIL